MSRRPSPLALRLKVEHAGDEPREPAATERRLAAILSADVAGYRRLMGDDDEEGTSFAVAVYAKAKMPRSDVAVSDLVPKRVEVPGRGRVRHRIPTRVIEQGEVRGEGDSDDSGLRG